MQPRQGAPVLLAVGGALGADYVSQPPAWRNAVSMVAGSNGGSAMAWLTDLLPAAQNEVRGAGRVGETFRGRSEEGAVEQGAGLAVGFTETDANLESGGPDQPFDHVGRGGARTGFDAADRRLRYSRAMAQCRLCKPRAPARLADEIA